MPGTSSTARPGRTTSSSARDGALCRRLHGLEGQRRGRLGRLYRRRDRTPARGGYRERDQGSQRGICALPGTALHPLSGGLAAVTGVSEAPLDRTENGLQAAGDGWFVVNARDAVWGESDEMGVFTRLGESPGLLASAARLQHRRPLARPTGLYVPPRAEPGEFSRRSRGVHSLRRGQQRQLKQWDYFHCPADTAHRHGRDRNRAMRRGRCRVAGESGRRLSGVRAARSRRARWRRRRPIRRRRMRGWKFGTRRTRTAGSRISSAAESVAWTGCAHSPAPSSAGSSDSSRSKTSARAAAACGRTSSTRHRRPSSRASVVKAASSSPQAVIQSVNGAGSRSTFSA